MASLAASASPSVLVNLKKRHLSSDAYEFDLPRSIKRCRNAETEEGEANAATAAADVPRFTQRQVDYWEQHKLADMARIRAECEQYVMKQNAEMQRYQQEVARLTQQLHEHEQETQRLQNENKLLKRAITIQNQHKEECEQENQRFRVLAVEAAEHIHRLEQTNYALQVHLQTSTQSSRGHPSHLPDVF